MANISHLRREKFDPQRSFFVSRHGGCKVNGEMLPWGSNFDKTAVNTRRLRQLYDTRTISHKPLEAAEPLPLNLEKMSEKQLYLFLEDNGVIPRHGAGYEWLLARAQKFVEESHGTA